jgi:hypothetical protein
MEKTNMFNSYRDLSTATYFPYVRIMTLNFTDVETIARSLL